MDSADIGHTACQGIEMKVRTLLKRVVWVPMLPILCLAENSLYMVLRKKYEWFVKNK